MITARQEALSTFRIFKERLLRKEGQLKGFKLNQYSKKEDELLGLIEGLLEVGGLQIFQLHPVLIISPN